MTNTNNKYVANFDNTAVIVKEMNTAFDFFQVLNTIAQEFIYAVVSNDVEKQEMLSEIRNYTKQMAAQKGFSELEIQRQSQFI